MPLRHLMPQLWRPGRLNFDRIDLKNSEKTAGRVSFHFKKSESKSCSVNGVMPNLIESWNLYYVVHSSCCLYTSCTIEMSWIYPFKIKMHHIFLRNDGQSKLQIAKIKNLHTDRYWSQFAKILQKRILQKKILQIFFCNIDWPSFRRKKRCFLILNGYMHGISMVHEVFYYGVQNFTSVTSLSVNVQLLLNQVRI